MKSKQVQLATHLWDQISKLLSTCVGPEGNAASIDIGVECIGKSFVAGTGRGKEDSIHLWYFVFERVSRGSG